MAPKIADYTDAELAGAVHFLDAHEDDLDFEEAAAWDMVKDLILGRAQSHREIEAENAA